MRNEIVGVHINWQNRYINDLIRPQARGIIRDVASQFGVEEIVTTRRTELQLEISDSLTSTLALNGLVLERTGQIARKRLWLSWFPVLVALAIFHSDVFFY